MTGEAFYEGINIKWRRAVKAKSSASVYPGSSNIYTKALLLPINACYLGSGKIKEKRQAFACLT
jgi:hypothetical protein